MDKIAGLRQNLGQIFRGISKKVTDFMKNTYFPIEKIQNIM